MAVPGFEPRPAGSGDPLFTPRLGSEGCLGRSLGPRKGNRGATVTEAKGWRDSVRLSWPPARWQRAARQEGAGVPEAGLLGLLLHSPPPSQQVRRVSRPRPHTLRDGRPGWSPQPPSHSFPRPEATGATAPAGPAGHAHTHKLGIIHTHTVAHGRGDEAWKPTRLAHPDGARRRGGRRPGPNGGGAEEPGPALAVGDHGGHGGRTTVTPPQAAGEERRLSRSPSVTCPATCSSSTIHPPVLERFAEQLCLQSLF